MDGATAAALTVAATSLGGTILAYRRAPSEEKRTDADIADIVIKSGDGRVKSLMEYVDWSNEKLEGCHQEIRNLRLELADKEALLMEQGRVTNEIIRGLRAELDDAKEHLAMLERRGGDWRRGEA